MKVIGLTGGVGSGKSYIADLVCSNFEVLHLNTDLIARSQMMKGGISYDAVVREFGPQILRDDGEIDRTELAAIVFKDEEKRLLLNGLTHPNVTAEVTETIGGAAQSGEYIAVLVETAILKEAGYDSFCDEIWYVRAPEEDRIARVMRSRGYSLERARSMIASQADDEEYAALATYIIDNPDGGDESVLREYLGSLLRG